MHIVARMTIAPEVKEIVTEAAAAQVPMTDVLKRAGIAQTTWGRWVRGDFEPRVSTFRKVRDALTAEIAGRAAA